jgi:hypothetical protein
MGEWRYWTTIPNLGTLPRWVSGPASGPAALLSGKQPPVPIVQEVGWAPESVCGGPMGKRKNILLLPGIGLRSLCRPAWSPYRAIPVPQSVPNNIAGLKYGLQSSFGTLLFNVCMNHVLWRDLPSSTKLTTDESGQLRNEHISRYYKNEGYSLQHCNLV